MECKIRALFSSGRDTSVVEIGGKCSMVSRSYAFVGDAKPLGVGGGGAEKRGELASACSLSCPMLADSAT